MTLNCRENTHRKSLSRLATVRHLALSTLALALGAAAAVMLVSCGGGEDAKLLPGNTAQEITENLDRVQQYTEEGECVGAEDAVGEVTTQVEALQGVDPKLEEALRRGAARLGEVVATCEEEETTETIAPAEESPSTEETERIPPGQEKKAEKDREKEERDLEKEAEKAEKEAEKAEKETPPAETPSEKTPPEATPKEGEGPGSSGGVGPSAPAAPEQGDEG
jgi:hypothetical protein